MSGERKLVFQVYSGKPEKWIEDLRSNGKSTNLGILTGGDWGLVSCIWGLEPGTHTVADIKEAILFHESVAKILLPELTFDERVIYIHCQTWKSGKKYEFEKQLEEIRKRCLEGEFSTDEEIFEAHRTKIREIVRKILPSTQIDF